MNPGPGMAYRSDEWLSGLLGKAVWHLTPTGAEMDQIPLPQTSPCFIDAKVGASDIETANRLQNAGFRLIETNIRLERASWPAAFSRTARFADDPDRAAVERIAESGFTYSRFHMDPMVPKAAADSVKRAWAGNYFDGKRGDHMVVSEVDGEIAGFLQLLVDGDNMTIDLVAVDSRFRGKGLARDMISFAEATIPNINRLTVGTQASNVRSLHAYVTNKFQFTAATYVFHFHG
ncbi:MAG: GNAT family N-acetyltransferase [Minwuia sp.]|uniref:GNAT family N-acetyltransferase n=1 Tax=Minwuia sp. TaxID=2493630 RepID=UPI003A89F9BA